MFSLSTINNTTSSSPSSSSSSLSATTTNISGGIPFVKSSTNAQNVYATYYTISSNVNTTSIVPTSSSIYPMFNISCNTILGSSTSLLYNMSIATTIIVVASTYTSPVNIYFNIGILNNTSNSINAYGLYSITYNPDIIPLVYK